MKNKSDETTVQDGYERELHEILTRKFKLLNLGEAGGLK
jgi:hypothetical protein